jgi:hypothetical protein
MEGGGHGRALLRSAGGTSELPPREMKPKRKILEFAVKNRENDYQARPTLDADMVRQLEAVQGLKDGGSWHWMTSGTRSTPTSGLRHRANIFP